MIKYKGRHREVEFYILIKQKLVLPIHYIMYGAKQLLDLYFCYLDLRKAFNKFLKIQISLTPISFITLLCDFTLQIYPIPIYDR